MSAKGILPFKQTDYPQNIGWIEVKIGEVCKLKNGFAFKSSEYKTEGIPIIRISDIKEGIVTCENSIKIEPKAEYEDYLIEKNDILIAMSGATTGKFGIFKDKLKAYQNQRVGNFKFLYNDELNKSFLFYQLYSLKQRIEKDAYGGAQPNISSKKIEEMEIIIAPPPEQRAIVSKIEQLFSELDNGIANLKLAQEQLKVYRQAVLKKAFEGELTKEWRENNSTGESDSKLLGLILENKKMKWESDQLGKLERTGKKPKDNLWKLKYKSPRSPNTAHLPDLPKSWSWASPEQIASWDDPYALAIGPFGSNLKVSDYTSEGIPLVFVRNIRSGVFDNENTKYVSKTKAEELRPHWTNSLDILITKMGEPPGDAYLYPVGRPLAIITADCIKFRLCSLLDNPIYFVHVINSGVVRSQISSITLGVAQKKISLERFKTIALPLPPAEEQKVIVQEIETRLSVCDKIEQDIETNLEKAEALRQSILKKAFEGKLLNERELAEVRGAEDWEPAEVLLERIKAEKAQNGKKIHRYCKGYCK